jgi:hypothetical protein
MATKADRRRWANAQWELDNLNALQPADREWLRQHALDCFDVEDRISQNEVELLMETVRR